MSEARRQRPLLRHIESVSRGRLFRHLGLGLLAARAVENDDLREAAEMRERRMCGRDSVSQRVVQFIRNLCVCRTQLEEVFCTQQASD